MTNHTQGVWAIQRQSVGALSYNWKIVQRDTEKEIADLGNFVDSMGFENEEKKANAILIASAPDLLEALEAQFESSLWFCEIFMPTQAGVATNNKAWELLRKLKGDDWLISLLEKFPKSQYANLASIRKELEEQP
jgi:hypothetical protein